MTKKKPMVKLDETNVKTVVGIVEAERLQKEGWRMVSASRPSGEPFSDKTYKFVKDEHS